MSFNEYYKKWKEDNNVVDKVQAPINNNNNKISINPKTKTSFSEYYDQWKKQNNITTERPFNSNTTTSEIKSIVDKDIDAITEKYKKTTNINVDKKNTDSQNKNQKNNPIDKIKELMSDTGKITENTWLGMVNGIKSAGQTLGRAITNSQAERADFANEMNKTMLEARLKEHPEEKEQISNNIDNPLISGDNIKKEAEETTKKIQEKKQENIKKIQDNAENINNPVGKHLAGDIMPSVGQMLPGLVGGGIGTTYFISSAVGNYYDDAKERGMSEEEAKKYSGIMGAIEGSLESIGGKLTTNVGKSLLKKNIKGALVNYGLDIAENFLEESVVEPISELVAQTSAGKDKANWDNMGERFLKSGIDGAITAMITGGASGLVGQVGSNIIKNKYKDLQTNKILSKDSQNILKQAEEIINQNNTSNLQQQSTQNQPTAPIDTFNQEQNNVAQNGNMEQILPNRINDKVNNYKNSIRDNFVADIDIKTESIYEGDKAPFDYNKANQSVLARKAQSLVDNFKRRVFKNNNEDIYVSNSDIKKSISETLKNKEQRQYKKENLAVFSQLDKVIENAQEISFEEADSKNRDYFNNYKYYVSNAYIDGNPFVVEFDTRMQDGANGGRERHFRLERVYPMNNKEVVSNTASNNLRGHVQNETTSFINNSIPPINNNVNNGTITNNYAQNVENDTLIPPTKGETINWNEVDKPEGKIRKHYRSIIESSNTTAEAKAIAKEMMGLDTYVPRSNQDLLQRADSRINTTDPDTELNSLYGRVMNNEKVNDVDIAVGERLIEYYSKIGDSEHLQDAIHTTALAGTQAGRTVQAMALLNHMTPQGQVVWLQRSIDKANNELQQKYRNKRNVPQFELTSEMTDKILDAKNKEEMFNTLDEVYEELGQQVPKTTLEKIDEWRYFSMLANVKTHARNMIGNIAMGRVQRVKNKVAGAIEGTVAKFNPEMERTHTLKPTSKAVKEFAKNDVKNMDVQTELGMNENKYNPQSRLQSARRTFKSDILENTLGEMYDLNSNLLGVEDNIGLKSMYVNALGEYITANKIDINNITDAQLSKARQHAIKEAQEATFHQASALATALNQMGRKNNITKFALDSAVPFKKTPINVAKTGVQYSPVGLVKSAVFDVGKVRNGKISVNQYIDNISKGLTGTGITFLGYALAQAGILKASGGDDDKKEQYDEEQGKQEYSIEIGGKTASLDWLSPVGMPLFIGAEINQQFNNSKKEKTSKSNDDNETLSKIVKSVSKISNASANAMNPMSEMSMVSGLTSILSSYNKENAVGNMVVNTGKSYINQFVPTAMGQLARTTDDYERTTKSTKTGTIEKAVDSTINQVKSKVPGLRQTLPVKTDIWGKEVKQDKNIPFRAFNNFINPSIIKDVSNDKVDKELNNLYSKTKESSIIPKAIEKTFTIDGTDYRMTNEEYSKYYRKYGETSYNLIKDFISTKDYKGLTDKQKQKAIEEIYSYAKENNKVNYAKANKIKIEKNSALYDTMEALKKGKGSQSSYLNYLVKTNEIEGEDANKKKMDILNKSEYTNNTKSIIYENTLGKNDKTYSNLKKLTNVNINYYLDYKLQDIKGDEDTSSNIKGKTKSGSKKEKVRQYLKNSNLSDIEKVYIYGKSYKLVNSDREILKRYMSSLTNEDLVSICKDLTPNFEEHKDGKYYWK